MIATYMYAPGGLTEPTGPRYSRAYIAVEYFVVVMGHFCFDNIIYLRVGYPVSRLTRYMTQKIDEWLINRSRLISISRLGC